MNASTTAPRDHVVVGTDGSPPAMAALDRAATEARRRAVPLEIVHGWSWGGAYEPTDDSSAILGAALRRVADQHPALPVVTTSVPEDAASVLVRRSGDARLTVLGTRGRGGFTGLLLGSVTLRVAAHCHSPLLVVRGTSDQPGRPEQPRERTVVLGVRTAADSAATAFAFEEAVRQQARLLTVHARPGPVGSVSGDPPAAADQAAGPPDWAGSEWRVTYPHVDVETRTVRGDPARTLVEATQEATAIVIAVHRRTTGLGMQLGPVTHALLHHSHAPVVMVPSGARLV
ncbi:universal stress protein [Streptomyces zagrosensis]|uniref:Nucleotide-binding universal stress UspA family protein n=1 Tax=Streptomyces zagrosensis TaxID=1042984 RepID=A0A7W9QFT8_9ACTN|nr:universal stress protein [Streptomyces zagrosensis]MBB5938427.1 nucleotide-binding universal stress UspA family protein [Streptomyces zagrosensis]